MRSVALKAILVIGAIAATCAAFSYAPPKPAPLRPHPDTIYAPAVAVVPPPGTLGPFDPPTMWREEYKKAERCVGKKGDINRIRGYFVPGQSFQPLRVAAGLNVRPSIAEWVPRAMGPGDSTHAPDSTNAVFVGSAWATTPWVVRHEFIHDITGLGHPHHDSLPPNIVDSIIMRCHATWGYLAGDSS